MGAVKQPSTGLASFMNTSQGSPKSIRMEQTGRLQITSLGLFLRNTNTLATAFSKDCQVPFITLSVKSETPVGC